MKLFNKSGNGYMHIYNDTTYTIASGGVADVPKDVADVWLKIKGIEKYIEPADLEKAAKEAEAKAAAERKALEDENAELKAKLKDLEKAAKKAK